MWSWQNVSLPSRVGLLWSNGDSKMPQTAFQEAVSNISVAEFWTEDINQSGHVFLNQDLTLAQRTVQFMLTGSAVLPETEDSGSEEETEESEQ